MKQLLLLATMCLVACQAVPEKPEDTRHQLQHLMQKHQVPGLQWVLFDQHTIHEQLALGYCDVRRPDTLRNHTPMELASLSKPVFYFLTEQLLSPQQLNQPLSELVNLEETFRQASEPRFRGLAEYTAFRDDYPKDWFEKITPLQLLTHTSGLGDWWKPQAVFIHPPGTKFYYSDDGYLLLQRALEHRTGRSLQALLDSLLPPELQPLGRFSAFEETDFCAAGHNTQGLYERDIWKASEALAHGSLLASASDFASFMQFLARNKRFPPASGAVPVANQLQWAPGWGLEQVGEELLYWHWGNDRFFQGFCGYFPERDQGFVLYTNSANGLPLIHEFLTLYLGYPLQSTRWVL